MALHFTSPDPRQQNISGDATLTGLALTGFTPTNATLTFTNWSTCLTASNVVVRSGSVVTLPAAFADNQMSNRVWIICTNLTVETGGVIKVDGCGYACMNGPNKGGSSGNFGGGGGHGGAGGGAYQTATGGAKCDLTNAPAEPGSGGGGSGRC